MDPEYWEKERPHFVKPLPATIAKPELIDGSVPDGEIIDADFDVIPPPALSAPKDDDTFTEPFPAVDAELKKKQQWVLWKQERRNGKLTKIPKQVSGENAKTNGPTTWTTYETAIKHKERFDGIGFVFTENDAYTGIDLDNCLKNGNQKGWAKPIIEKLKVVSYGEVSPSGNGIKFWTRAKLPTLAKHKVYINESTGEAIEAYDNTRYFTVTGQGKGQIGDGQTVIDWLVREYLTEKPKPPPTQQTHKTASVDEVINLIQKSRQCHKFNALMEGKTTGYGSQSEADQALCGIIVFWTQAPQVIDTIFRTSKLYRDKWDEKHRSDGATYGQMTIEKALSGNRQTYTPSQTKKQRRPQAGFYQARARRRRYR